MKFKLTIRLLITVIITIALSSDKVLANKFDIEMFNNISIDEGLSDEYVTSIFEDSKGYIWIGTKDGLNRFDGERVKIYNCSNKEENMLSSTYINDIEEDCYGNVWIATDNGLDILLRDKDKIIRIKDMDEEISILGQANITQLLRSSSEDEIIWVGTNKGLVKINVKESKIENIYTAEDNENQLTSSYITKLEEGNSPNTLYVGTPYGINLIDYDSNEINYALEFFEEKLYINDITKDSKGNIWVVTKECIAYASAKKEEEDYVWIINYDGIKKCNKQTGEIYYTYKYSESSFPGNIECILVDSIENVWISSDEGIVRYSDNDKSIKHITNDTNNNVSLISNYINCFYEDSNGTIWIGTEKGISILNRNNQFTSVTRMIDKEGNLINANVVSIIQNGEEVWIATKFNGIYIYDKTTGEFITRIYENDNISLRDRKLKDIFKINEKYMTLITNKDIILVNIGEYLLQKIYKENEHSFTVKHSYSDGEKIWLASTEGLYCYDTFNDQLMLKNDNLLINDINAFSLTYILPDKSDEDILWLAGINTGLIKYHKKNGVINQYKDSSLNKSSLINTYTNCMEFDSSGNLWIGTNMGLYKFDLAANDFTSYTIEEGLTNNFINSILVDDNNNLWISTNKGLNKINTSNEEIRRFTRADGIMGYQFNLNSSLKLDNGDMLFGSTNGITSFNPEEIDEIRHNVNKVVIGDISVGKNKIIYNGEELVLDYDNKDLYIEFFMPYYENLNNITYQYMIEGIDTEWVYIDSMSHLDIKFLDPGKYKLKIRSRDGNGDLSKETIMNIKVKNPIWKSPMAYIIYIIVLSVLIIYIFNYVKILRKLVEQKTLKLNKQLEENRKLSEEIIKKEKFKNNYFVNLSHELRTPIHVISSATQLINSLNKEESLTKENLRKYINIISKNCGNLLKIINDIIDSSKIETGHYKINKKNNDIVYLVEETALNMGKYIEEKGLTLIIDPDMEEKVILCDENELERCVINLLGNAVKFTPKGGEIRVLIKEVNDYVEIIVEDTGIGISKDDQEFIFNRFSQVENNLVTKASSSGIGLTLVKLIADLHGGYVKLESEPNKGSRFILAIPDIADKIA